MKWFRINAKHARGQALLEYSLLNWVLIASLILGLAAPLIPQNGGANQSVIQLLVASFQIYYDSFYFVLNLPFP